MDQSNNQTAPAKSGRGGRRTGAGRKPKGFARASILTERTIAAALAAPPPDEIETRAQKKAREVIEAGVKLMLHGKSEAARVQAASIILDRAYGRPSVAAGGDPLLPFLGSKPIREGAPEIRDLARKYGELAMEVLETIALRGESEGAAATAMKALLDRGCGTVAVAKVPDELAGLRKLGKKEQAAQAAEAAATGLYATPEPPRAAAGKLN